MPLWWLSVDGCIYVLGPGENNSLLLQCWTASTGTCTTATTPLKTPNGWTATQVFAVNGCLVAANLLDIHIIAWTLSVTFRWLIASGRRFRWLMIRCAPSLLATASACCNCQAFTK